MRRCIFRSRTRSRSKASRGRGSRPAARRLGVGTVHPPLDQAQDRRAGEHGTHDRPAQRDSGDALRGSESGDGRRLDLVIQPAEVIGSRLLGRTPVAEPRVLDRHGGVGGDAPRDPGRGADDRMVADDRLAAEDRGVGVDDHLVLDGRVPLLVAEDVAVLVAGEAQGAERHALVDLHPVADVGRLADDDARAVVDEEPPADRGAGVDVDARLAVGVLGHHPRDQRHAQLEQLVRDPEDGDRREAGVAEEDLVEVLRGGVAVEGRLDVLGQDLPQLGDRVEQPDRDDLRLGLEIGLELRALQSCRKARAICWVSRSCRLSTRSPTW